MAKINPQLAIAVIKPGVNSQIQDSGRFGYLQMGLSQSGALDEVAYRYNNALLNNADNAAQIEIAVGGAEFVFLIDSVIALSGASAAIKLNNVALSNWSTHAVSKGDVLNIGGVRHGMFIYLGIAGGFCCDTVKGSQSTTVRLALGGYHGRALQANDKIAANPTSSIAKPNLTVPQKHQQQYFNQPIKVMPGYQFERFDEPVRTQFFANEYQLLRGNRMGYFFDSNVPLSYAQGELSSEGILPGAIQITNAGQPIVLHKDAQSIGGYPKIGAVSRLSLSIIAQLTPGKSIQFQRCDEQTAIADWQAQLSHIQQLQCYWYRWFYSFSDKGLQPLAIG